MGGALPRRFASRARTGAGRPVHAAQPPRPRLFDQREVQQPDTLSHFEHWWATPMQAALLLFGFANARVPLAQIGPGRHVFRTCRPPVG
jgi:hypothetical protein